MHVITQLRRLEVQQLCGANQWAVRCPSWEHLLEELGVREAPISRLGLITKERPDGSLKHRLIWDLLRSGVNSFVYQG